MTQRALKHGAMTHIWRTGGVRIEAAKALAGKGTKKVLGKAAAATKKAAKQAKPRKMLQKQMLKDAAAGAIAGGITGAVAGGPADATVGTSGEVVGGASGAYAEGETWFSVFYFFFLHFLHFQKEERERETGDEGLGEISRAMSRTCAIHLGVMGGNGNAKIPWGLALFRFLVHYFVFSTVRTA